MIGAITAGLLFPVIPKSVVTGGTLTSDSTYFYRTFTGNGTLGVTGVTLDADTLIIAGGGGGMTGKTNTYLGSGGGAGQAIQFNRSLVNAQNYTVTIGGGGAGTGKNTLDTNGSNGIASSLIGGAVSDSSSVGIGGQFDTGKGGNSGNSFTGGDPNGVQAGAGAGAGANGGNATGSEGGAGGAGLDTWSSWATATSTGVSGFYAGGGGGTNNGARGSGGGGRGGLIVEEHNGTANTGSGGGGGAHTSTDSGNGGNGIVIVRYLKTAV